MVGGVGSVGGCQKGLPAPTATGTQDAGTTGSGVVLRQEPSPCLFKETPGKEHGASLSGAHGWPLRVLSPLVSTTIMKTDFFIALVYSARTTLPFSFQRSSETLTPPIPPRPLPSRALGIEHFH